MISNRLYWKLLDDNLMFEFLRWLRDEYPLVFTNLVGQFIQYKVREQ